MKNSQENTNPTALNYQKQAHNSLYQLLYIINEKQALRTEFHSILVAANAIVVLLIYLSFPQIGLLTPFLRFDNQLTIICLFCSILLIVFQFLLGILYNKHILLKLQLIIYRNIVFPIAFFSLISHTPQIISLSVLYIIAIACIILLFLFQPLLGKESFVKNMVIERGMPLSTYMLIFQIFLFMYYKSSPQFKKLAVVIMSLIGIITKFCVIDANIRRSKCFQYTLYKIQSTSNLIYTAFLAFNQILPIPEIEKEPSVFIFPLLFFIILSEIFSQYSDQMKPLKNTFFTQYDNIQLFLLCVQYVVDDLIRLTTTEGMQISSTCLVPIYYEHVKNCKNPQCSITLSPQLFSSNGKYKNVCNSVLKIIEQLFQNHISIQDENFYLKFALLKFYKLTGSNKFKIMEMVAELEKQKLSLNEEIKIYAIKRYISDVDVIEFFESMKIQNSFQTFNHNMSTLMKLLIQFWVQFLEERVDFQKIISITQKITPALQAIETKMQQALTVQTFSTIRIMKIYSQYCRWIMNDEVKATMISDYTSLLVKKMSQVHEINCMTADMEIGLIAIQLNSRRLGEIKIANNQAANIFNYSKEDFLKLNVNDIMPRLFATYHDDYLKAFIVNSHKKVNTDKRLIIGKRKQGSLFQIYLQLQKSIVTLSQQLIFIANIELARTQQANILIICDDKGTINDVNSTYVELFQKSLRKNKAHEHKPYTNIQEIIPSFFEVVMTGGDNGTKEISECYDNPIFGILDIKFQITKISLQYNPDAGYLIKGYRGKQLREPFFKNLSLTKTLVQLAQERDLKGMKIQYCSQNNQYCFTDRLDVLASGEYRSQFTIPYVKVQQFSKIFGQDYDGKKAQLDADIKTIRFCKDHFQRVEQPQSFESDISQEQKTIISDTKVGIIKQKLQNQENYIYQNFPKLLSFFFAVICIILLTVFYVRMSDEKNNSFKSIFQYVQQYRYRGKLAEYVVYFQAQNDPIYGAYFTENKNKLKTQLIDEITQADITQTQKQRALKIVYLEQTLQTMGFEQLVNDETFMLNQLTTNTLQQKEFITFEVIVGTLIIIKLIMNFFIIRWHQSKLINIFTLFLSLSEMDIKGFHKKCVEFLKNSNQVLNQMELKITALDDDPEEGQQENPHIKIRRFKNISIGRSPYNFLKLNLVSLLLLVIFAALLINNLGKNNHLQLQISSYEFVATVMPEYSVTMMKYYSQKNNYIVKLQEDFIQKYQTIDYKLANLNQNTNDLDFSGELFENKCSKMDFKLPNTTTCETIEGGVMTDGVSSAVNLISISLTKIANLPGSSEIVAQLNQLSILMYHLVQPVLENILKDQESQLLRERQQLRILMLVYFILLLAVAISDVIYQTHYPLNDIANNIAHSKNLIKLIRENKKKNKNGYTQI